jgi:hypothetical protein
MSSTWTSKDDIDPGRYRKIYTRIWKALRGLKADEKAIAFYLLTGDQTNRIGFYDFSMAKGAEDLETLPQTFRKGFQNVLQRLAWEYDDVNRVLYIPTWWKWNPPENPNVLKGNLNDLQEVAHSPLLDKFINNTEYLQHSSSLVETFTQTLAKRLGERYPKPSRKQKQEQEQEQEKRYIVVSEATIDPEPPASPPADLDSNLDSKPAKPAKPAKPKLENIPCQAIIDLWNAHAPKPLPRSSLTDKRKPKIKAAWQEYPSLDWWQELFGDIALSPWHSHRDRWQGNSFDWMIKNRTEMREKLTALKGNSQMEAFFRGPVAGGAPDPPGIMVPDPNCPLCRGNGLARDGPCECLRPENPDDPYWQKHPEKLTRFKHAKPTQTIGQARA